MRTPEGIETPKTIDTSFIDEVKSVLNEHKSERVVVVGTTCTGKSTLLKNIDGALDMDEVLFPQLTEEEKEFVTQKPWTEEIGQAMIRLAKERIKIEPGNSVFGTVVLDADTVVYLHIEDELLRARVEKRGKDFEDAKNMQKQIEEEIESSQKPMIEIQVK